MIVVRPTCQQVLHPAARLEQGETCEADVAVGQEYCPGHGGIPADTTCAHCGLPMIASEAEATDDHGSVWCSEACVDEHNDQIMSVVAS